MERTSEAIEPFEICTIRPPTENHSLTFRLTRNCGWNRCLFCPVYKLGARFSRRTLDEVKKDVDRAKRIDDLLTDMETGTLSLPGSNRYERAARLVERVNASREQNQVSSGRLPTDRERMIGAIDQYLSLSARGKPIFSFTSRFDSFMEEYGGLPQDILCALSPYIRGGRIDISRTPNDEISKIIRLMRGKLMP